MQFKNTLLVQYSVKLKKMRKLYRYNNNKKIMKPGWRSTTKFMQLQSSQKQKFVKMFVRKIK